MKKRGQLTIFIIIGIVLLFAFGFIFFVKNLFFEAKVEAETQEKLTNVFQSEAFKTYTSSCLEKVSQEAILLLGKQGGVIYKEQGGMIERGKYVPIQSGNKNISVSYGILWQSIPEQQDFVPLGAFTTLPDYPRIENIFGISYFGNNNLPYICQPEGPNQESTGDIRREICTFLDPFVKEGYGPDSIQEQLSYYIANKIDDCINLTEIPGLGEVIIEEGNYDVEVIFGKENIIINAIVPIVLSAEGETMTQRAEISTTLDVRLKQVYELAHTIVENDKKWLSFEKTNFTKKLESLGKLKPGMNIELICPFCDYGDYVGYNYDDLIKITDTKSIIEKEPFVFIFVIENRFPALERIAMYNPFNESPLSDYDMITTDSKKISIKPKGYDPDEDNLTYVYEGWREDYYTLFDLQCCQGYGGNVDCRENYSECMTIYDIIPPEDWTKSDEFKDTRKDASYTTELTDIGLHNLTVKIIDKGNLSDWQVIEIMVVDMPIAIGSGFNNYSGVNRSRASIEDPYHLNASSSISIMLPIADYSWFDSLEPFKFEYIKQTILRLPYGNYDITNIKSKNFNTTVLNGIEHKINLIVSNKISTSEQISFNVSVHQCLPYDNSAGNFAPWPYNNLNINSFDNVGDIENPFLADHKCCDNYNYEDTAQECYRHTEYGTYQYIKNNPLTDDYLPGTSALSQEPIATPSGYQNDVYTRVFTSDCSGDRGNTCEGNREIVVTHVQACHDVCQRPGSYSRSDESTVPNSISCQSLGIANYIRISGEGFTLNSGRCSDLDADPWHTYSGDNKVRCKYGCSASGCNVEVDCECKPEYVAQGYCYTPIACIADESCHPSGNRDICEHGTWQYDIRCDDCGHVCDLEGYPWYNPYCWCSQGGCPAGYNYLGQTSDCNSCCATNNPP